MSLPKEPRQLMINLMYLVLTAILALNVSAEVLSAFITIDNSIKQSNDIVERSNGELIRDINDQASAYQQYEYLQKKAKKTQTYTQSFVAFIEDIKQAVLVQSGGLNEDGLPKGIKDKDVTTRLLVDEGQGDVLEKKIITLRDSFLQLIDSAAMRNYLDTSLNIKVDPLPPTTKMNSWAEFKFKQMPVAAVLPLLSKLQNDAKLSETSLLNYFYSKMANTKKHDRYEAIISADKSYVIKGEELNAEIFLGAYSSTTDNINITVNGRAVPVRNGKAIFKTRPDAAGAQAMDVRVRVRDPLTGAEETYRRQFHYEVGERSVAVSADKMNVFYVGVENPISVSVAGVPSNQVEVKGEGVNPVRKANGKFVVKPSKAGLAKITVSGGGLPPTTFDYRIKPIPDPELTLGKKNGGLISAAELKVYDRITPQLKHFDFKARCNVIEYEVVRAPRNDDIKSNQNKGEKFDARSRRIINQARSGDTYYFDNIKVKCPGDRNSRNLGGLVFKIK